MFPTNWLGSGLCSGGMPLGLNCITSLDGWCDALGFWGILGSVLPCCF